MSRHRQQNSRSLANINIGVNGIPHDLKVMYTTYNQSFQILCSVGLVMVEITENCGRQTNGIKYIVVFD